MPEPERTAVADPAEGDAALAGQRRDLEAALWLKAVVENSDDAILSKTLDGVITTWNRGAERLFGYTAQEAVGQSITIVIPPDRLSEEDEILRQLRAGDRVDHFETVRRRKNGELVEVSLTVSPVLDAHGAILGASKIARDISEHNRLLQRQRLLLGEMNHRIKNLFTVIGGLVTLSARETQGAEALALDLRTRIHALAQAHALTLPDIENEGPSTAKATVNGLLEAILAPHRIANAGRIGVSGDDAPLAGSALTSMALLLHELATNAAKYGALSSAEGCLGIEVRTDGETARIVWKESGVSRPTAATDRKGFGSTLEQAALRGLGGRLERNWTQDGLAILLEYPLSPRAR